MPGAPEKSKRYTDSINYAIEGILYAARSQRHMRNHFLAALAILALVLFLEISGIELVLLVLAISLVLCAELMNTAIELCVDLVSPDHHPLAKAAKDVAAGAVLTAAIGAAVMGYLILSRYFFPPYKEVLGMIGVPSGLGSLVAILGVVLCVVLLKACTGRGTPLEGGSVSGHAAVSFAIAVVVTFTSQDPLSSLLTLVLAVMVSNSRVTLGLHSLPEVVRGAAVGIFVSLLVMALFARFH